jgi:hypothetical protein
VQDSQDFISGIPGRRIENVSLSDIYISYAGNGTRAQAQREIPEELKTYPKIGMFGDLPSYGFYVRHVAGIRLSNIRFDFISPDLRPALFFDDVSDVSVSGCLLEGAQAKPLIQLNNVVGAYIHNNHAKGDVNVFVNVSGKESKDILLKDNRTGKTAKISETGKEVKGDVVKESL